MSQPAYRVVLPVFEGPLDLLLHLIEREELDITLVSLAQVTQQFLDYVTRLSESEPDRLADFLVVAAKLLLIKSRALLPKPPAAALPVEEEVGQDLVQQLIEYRKYKQAAGWLGDLEEQGLASYIRLSSMADAPRPADLTGVTLDTLLAAVREVLEIGSPLPSANGTIAPLTISVAQQIERIESEIARAGELSFVAFLRQAGSRLEIVVTLLAVLELVKRGRATMRQNAPFGDIWIAKLVAAGS
jgi:segregation and condensation protein A